MGEKYSEASPYVLGQARDTLIRVQDMVEELETALGQKKREIAGLMGRNYELGVRLQELREQNAEQAQTIELLSEGRACIEACEKCVRYGRGTCREDKKALT